MRLGYLKFHKWTTPGAHAYCNIMYLGVKLEQMICVLLIEGHNIPVQVFIPPPPPEPEMEQSIFEYLLYHLVNSMGVVCKYFGKNAI
jgi:hypothetical protein